MEAAASTKHKVGLSNPAVMLGIVTQILVLYYHNKVARNIEGIF